MVDGLGVEWRLRTFFIKNLIAFQEGRHLGLKIFNSLMYHKIPCPSKPFTRFPSYMKSLHKRHVANNHSYILMS